MNECSNILQGTYSNITLENIQRSSSTLNVPSGFQLLGFLFII